MLNKLKNWLFPEELWVNNTLPEELAIKEDSVAYKKKAPAKKAPAKKTAPKKTVKKTTKKK